MWSEVSEQVVNYINNKLLFAQETKRLSETEILVLKAAWDDVKYEEIMSDTEYTSSYLQGGIAPNLWRLLTDVIGSGEVITKKRFRSFMELRLRNDLGLDSEGREVVGDAALIGDPPNIQPFYGRKAELQILGNAVKENKAVIIGGIAGVGKTALAAKLLESLKQKSEGSFDFLIWKPIYYGPSPGSLVTELLKLFPLNRRESGGLASEEARMTKLIDYLRSNRILLVLDEAESLLHGEDSKFFLRRIVEEQHNSCVLLTSRELYQDTTKLGISDRSIQFIKLKGLTIDDALEIVKARGLTVTSRWEQLIDLYQGIPGVIDMVTSQVQRLFGGNVEEFFSYKTSLMGDYIQKVFGRELGENDALSNLKFKIIEYLSHHTETHKLVSFQELLKGLSTTEDFSILDFKKSLEGLVASSIIEVQTDSSTKAEKYCVNSLVMKYIAKGRLTPVAT